MRKNSGHWSRDFQRAGRLNKAIATSGLPYLLCMMLLGVLATARTPNSVVLKEGSAPRPELVLQTGHSLGARCVVFATDGSWVASGGADNEIRIWQVATGRELRALTGHSGYVRSIAVSPDGQWLASGSNDRTVKIWSVISGSLMNSLSGHTASIESLAFSADNRWLASGSTDKTIRIWDLTTGNLIGTLDGHAGSVGALAFSSDGKFLASGSADTSIKIWETIGWKEVRTLKKHTARITAVAFSPDGKWFSSASTDGTISLWPNGSDRERFTLKHNASSVLSVAFASGSSLLSAHADGGIESWDFPTGKLSHSIAADPNADQLAFAAFSTDARALASSSGSRTIDLRNAASGKTARTLESHASGFNEVIFSRDGRLFAAAANDSSIRLWQTATGRELPRLSGHSGYVTTVAFSVDSRLLASAGISGEVKIWDMATGRLAFDLPSNPKGINSVAFSPDGKFLAVAGIEHSVDIWDLQTRHKRSLAGHSNEITSVIFSANGTQLFSGGRDKTIRIWDVKTGTSTRTIDNLGAEINSLALSSDGTFLASANSDKTVRLIDLQTDNQTKTLSGHSGAVLKLVFSPDGQVLASAGSDGTVKIWEPRSGNELRTLVGPFQRINGVAFTRDGDWILTAGADGRLNLWDSKKAVSMATLVPVPASEDWLVATPDGLFDGSAAAWNLVLWRFGGNTFNVLPIEAYFKEFYYPGLLADILAGRNPKAATDITQKDRRQPAISISSRTQVTNKVTARNVTVQLDVAGAVADKEHPTSSGARDLRLFRNGLLIKTWPGDVLEASGKRNVEISIPIIAGENHLSAYAFNNDDIKSANATLTLTGAENLKRQGTAYVIAIGVEQYENPQYNLNYPVADAGAISLQLKDHQERLGHYNPVVIVQLLNSEAIKDNILLALSRLSGAQTGQLPPGSPSVLANLKQAQPEDAVVVYFSGHGISDRDRFFLIPHDLGYKGPRAALGVEGLQTIFAHSISDVELEDALLPIDADQLLLVIDACKSGQALNAEEERRGPMNTRGLAQLAYEKGMYVLTASQSNEVAFESKALKHSYLAFALVEEGIKYGSADMDHDGRILLQEWFAYATERVPQIRRERYRLSKELVEEEADEQKVQRPRVFYTRETGAQQLVIARVATKTN